MTIDKNERITKKKKSIHLTITEREIELIELLFNEKKPLSKKYHFKRQYGSMLRVLIRIL